MNYDIVMEFVVKYSRIADFGADVGFVIAVYVLCPIFLFLALRKLNQIERNTRKSK